LDPIPPSPAPQRDFSLRYIVYAKDLIVSYKGKEPFHLYLKKYFSLHKKHGSRDRRIITSLCYNYFRLGGGVQGSPSPDSKIMLATFLCETQPSEWMASVQPRWNEAIAAPLEEKLKMVAGEFAIDFLFLFLGELSPEIDRTGFSLSFLIQPALFLRIRPGHSDEVIRKLKASGLEYYRQGASCLSLSGNPKIDSVLDLNREAVIQDANSQKTLDFVTSLFTPEPNRPVPVWDCCAGSGGKSILVHDLLSPIRLTVSDRRPAILKNLAQRFWKAGIDPFEVRERDLEKGAAYEEGKFDLVIADVPCSGSGTWARTPEQHLFFELNQLKGYCDRQRKIIKNVLPCLNSGGYLCYITCSVFKKENEENVDFFASHFSLSILKKEYLKGYHDKADTMFVAVLKKNT
ncbi:MAG: methyltransferase domain-containing protein, partial [Bacteroidota bacterium]|nr:methyltransferase domain-containing protein [Bacteroidota bacterium]